MAINVTHLMNELIADIKKDRGHLIRRGVKKQAEDVRDHIARNTPSPENPHPGTITGHPPEWPYATGESAESVVVERIRRRFRLPAYRVVTYSEIFHFLEYGTAEDAPGTHSPWGRETPTFEYAPFRSAVHRFGGTMD